MEWTEYDQCGWYRTEVDRIGPMWMNGPNRTKVDQRGQNKLIRTEVDQIGLLNIYHF